MMVVSLIGEIWSPHTAPAIHAEIEMMRKGSAPGNTAMQIGIRIPKVPQEVPVANARKPATRKMMERITQAVGKIGDGIIIIGAV